MFVNKTACQAPKHCIIACTNVISLRTFLLDVINSGSHTVRHHAMHIHACKHSNYIRYYWRTVLLIKRIKILMYIRIEDERTARTNIITCIFIVYLTANAAWWKKKIASQSKLNYWLTWFRLSGSSPFAALILQKNMQEVPDARLS